MRAPLSRVSGPGKRLGGGLWGKTSLVALLGCLIFLSVSPGGWAADCPDNDEDGWVVCNDCSVPEGKTCGDCNDKNASIHPGAQEICCDGVDNNCNESQDEGCRIGEECWITSEGEVFFEQGEGEVPSGCLTPSVIECNDGVRDCPVPEGGLLLPVPEVAYTELCHDGADNDCDRFIDGEDPDCSAEEERCNGLDDNFNGQTDEGFSLGEPCAVGQGACAREGVTVCAEDGLSTQCSASPGTPQSENTPGTGRCIDGIDNDCDGDVDMADEGCRGTERCDGLDNDGDGYVDEDFEDLGQPCIAGLGACQNEGTVVCSRDGRGTMCSALAGLASIEGPTGPTCSDGIDNDCDGYTDDEDTDCSSAGYTVSCALPYEKARWRPGWRNCVGLHRIQIFSNVDLEEHPEAVLTAELLALDRDGNIMTSIPVQDGDLARLASRVEADDWISVTRPEKGRHKLFAPVPMLRVMLNDGKNKAEAYCSPIPYVQVLEPKGTVVTASEGDVTRLRAAIPLIHPRKVQVTVDGVEIFSALGIANPAVCDPSTPCSGVALINGQSVEITDLVVQSSTVWDPGMNMVTMQLSNLGCGGHIFRVNGIPRNRALPSDPDEQCLVDDFFDKGSSSGLSIEIDSPEEFAVLDPAPVQVSGTACSGREIAGVEINGRVVNVSGQVYLPGDGETTGDLYEVSIEEMMGMTDLGRDLATGDAPLGTFDLGSNRLSAMVMDDLGNRSFDAKVFALGDVAGPGFEQALQATLQEDLVSQVMDIAMDATTEIDNAFVVGMSKSAIEKLFAERCTAAAQEFVNNLNAELPNQVVWGPSTDYDDISACSCQPAVTVRITGFSADPNQASCGLTFMDGKIKVTMNLPPVNITLSADGYCRIGEWWICIADTRVSGYITASLTNSKVDFEITEAQLLGEELPGNPVLTPPTITSDAGNVHVSIGCLADVCEFFVTPFALLVNAIGGERLIPVVGFGMTLDFNFEDKLATKNPDPIKLGEIKLDEQKMEEFSQKLEGVLSEVEITPNGLVAGLTGRFETLDIDPAAEMTPGAVLTPAGLPSMPVLGADEVFMALADDTFNQFFASMVMAGRLETGCTDTGKTVGDLLPASCDSLLVGECSNDDTIACNEDTDCGGGTCVEAPLKTAVAKGACHAFKGNNCDALPVLWGQRLTCKTIQAKLQEYNISADQGLLFCMRQDIPPRLLIQDNASTGPVETALRLNDLSVALVLDREGDGLLGGGTGTLSSTHNCLAQGAPTVGDCSLFAACLDLNLETAMQFASKNCQEDPGLICASDGDCPSGTGPCVDACETGEPGFVARVNAVQILDRAFGVVCGGGTAAGDDELLANTSAEQETIEVLMENANRFTPPACIKGLTLGDFVTFKNPKLFAIDIDGDPTFDDYLGLTGEVE